MTLNDLIALTRLLVHDNETSETWDDTKYALAASDGARYIAVHHPESRLSATGTLTDGTDCSADTPLDTLWLPDVYKPSLAEYMAFRYFNSDSGDTRNQTLAKEHWERFLRSLMPVGR